MLPLGQLRDLARRLSQLEAKADLRLLSVVTFPHWSGESKNHKAAAREGDRKRRKFVQHMERLARGLGKFDAVDGVDVLGATGDIGGDLRAWMGAHGIHAAA